MHRNGNTATVDDTSKNLGLHRNSETAPFADISKDLRHFVAEVVDTLSRKQRVVEVINMQSRKQCPRTRNKQFTSSGDVVTASCYISSINTNEPHNTYDSTDESSDDSEGFGSNEGKPVYLPYHLPCNMYSSLRYRCNLCMIMLADIPSLELHFRIRHDCDLPSKGKWNIIQMGTTENCQAIPYIKLAALQKLKVTKNACSENTQNTLVQYPNTCRSSKISAIVSSRVESKKPVDGKHAAEVPNTLRTRKPFCTVNEQRSYLIPGKVDQPPKYQCKLCSLIFVDFKSLRSHFVEEHKCGLPEKWNWHIIHSDNDGVLATADDTKLIQPATLAGTQSRNGVHSTALVPSATTENNNICGSATTEFTCDLRNLQINCKANLETFNDTETGKTINSAVALFPAIGHNNSKLEGTKIQISAAPSSIQDNPGSKGLPQTLTECDKAFQCPAPEIPSIMNAQETGTKSTTSSSLETPATINSGDGMFPLKNSQITGDTANAWLQCQHCDESFKFGNLVEHAKKEHKDLLENNLVIRSKLVYQCHICPEKCITKEELDNHVKLHKEDTPQFSALPLKCKLCEKTFTKKRYLTSHLRRHRKMLKCKLCPEVFTEKESFIIHLKQHKKEKLFKCRYCEEVFAEKETLNVHLKEHAKKHFFCKLCPASFRAESYFMSHLMKHKGINPFTCTKCPGKFTSERDLKIHLTTHAERLSECTNYDNS